MGRSILLVSPDDAKPRNAAGEEWSLSTLWSILVMCAPSVHIGHVNSNDRAFEEMDFAATCYEPYDVAIVVYDEHTESFMHTNRMRDNFVPVAMVLSSKFEVSMPVARIRW